MSNRRLQFGSSLVQRVITYKDSTCVPYKDSTSLVDKVLYVMGSA
jgi:hypothetical protein